MDANWAPKIPLLVDAFLRWKNGPAAADTQPPIVSEATIDVLDIFSGATSATIPLSGNQTFAEALVCAGYLGTTPLFPSLAISLKTLELFRVIRLFKASFSVEAFAKLCCHMYYVCVLNLSEFLEWLMLYCDYRFRIDAITGLLSLTHLTSI